MSDSSTYVRKDEHGVLRVGDTRVAFDSVAAAFDQGHSPEMIRQQYPSLTLEAVYGAITWYLAHPDEARGVSQSNRIGCGRNRERRRNSSLLPSLSDCESCAKARQRDRNEPTAVFGRSPISNYCHQRVLLGGVENESRL
jgi:uncharacterized protein (DUF433 family)